MRISTREAAKALASQYAPGIIDYHKRELEAYQIMLEEELFEVEEL